MNDDPGLPEPADPPLLRVVRGTPDPVELAALVAVVAAASATDSVATTDPAASSRWAAHEHLLRAPLPRGGWRASSLPR